MKISNDRSGLKKNGSPDAYIETDPDRTYFIIAIPCHKDFVTDELVVDPSGNVVGKDWVTKLGQSWVREDDAAKAIESINSLYHIDLTASQAGLPTGLLTELLSTLTKQNLSSRNLLERLGLTYQKKNRDKYISPLVEIGVIAWDESLSKRSPNQTLHLTDLGKAVLQRIKK